MPGSEAAPQASTRAGAARNPGFRRAARRRASSTTDERKPYGVERCSLGTLG